MNYFPLYASGNPFSSYDNSFILYTAQQPYSQPYSQPRSRPHLRPRSRPRSRPRVTPEIPGAFCLRHNADFAYPKGKEYTDEKVNFFEISEDDDTLEAYFLDFWNMCCLKNKKKCDTCLQPFYSKQALEKAEFELTCVICIANKKSMVFVDCGHFAVCFKCSKQCVKCPICSKVSKNILKVFLS